MRRHRLRGTRFTDATGSRYRVHPRANCTSDNCVIHHPSKHHMRQWPIVLRLDRGDLAERICPHGIGHPDPDSGTWMAVHDPVHWADGVHGCDGCCVPPERLTAPTGAERYFARRLKDPEYRQAYEEPTTLQPSAADPIRRKHV